MPCENDNHSIGVVNYCYSMGCIIVGLSYDAERNYSEAVSTRGYQKPFVIRRGYETVLPRLKLVLSDSTILGHGANTVAANYCSGYALGVMREHMEKAW